MLSTGAAMTLKSSVNILFGGHLGDSRRLLQAADRGDGRVVAEVRELELGVSLIAYGPEERAPSLTCPPVPGYPCRLSRDIRSWLLSVAFTTTRPCCTGPQVRGGFLWVRGCMVALAATPSIVRLALGMRSWAGTRVCYR